MTLVIQIETIEIIICINNNVCLMRNMKIWEHGQIEKKKLRNRIISKTQNLKN